MKNLLNSIKGQVIVFIAIALVVLLALAGLAVDIGMAYGVKAKLNAAVDAAAIAAGRVIAQGSGAASTQAANFFNANYPSGLLGSTVSAPNTIAVHNADGSWTITVTASASVPTNFAKVVGWRNFTVNASAETTVRTLDMMLVLDCSGSLGSAFGPLKTAAVNFINKFQEGPGGDRVGLVTFAAGAHLDVPINKTSARGFTRSSITSVINDPSLISSGTTASEEAMRLAKSELDAIPSTPTNLRSTLRVIVFFSDGAPNTIAGNFVDGGTTLSTRDLFSETSAGNPPNHMSAYNLRNSGLPDANNITLLPNTDWSGTVNLASYNNMRSFGSSPIPNTRCNVNMAARNMLENIANTARSGIGNDAITIHVIGFGDFLNGNEIKFCGYNSTENGANILKRVANSSDSDTLNTSQPSGLYIAVPTTTQLDAAFTKIANQILRLSK